MQTTSQGSAPGRENSKVLTLDDLRELLSDMARDGDGAQRTQAARLLMSMSGSGDSALPDPLTTAEAVERLMRLMRGFGQKLSRIAFIRAFPRRDGLRKLRYEDLMPEEMGVNPETLPATLKSLRKRYPETVAKGTPKGYPRNAGMEEIKKWCQNAAMKIETDRMKAMRAETQASLEEERRARKDNAEETG
jgi:hypothetical protein